MEHCGYLFLTNISITAFSIISESYNLDKVSSSEEDCVSEDSEPPPTNSVMNNMMNSLYSQPRKPLAPKPISEPIDISSGDENEDDSNTKTTNGDGVAAAAAPPLLHCLYNCYSSSAGQCFETPDGGSAGDRSGCKERWVTNPLVYDLIK